MAKKNSEEQEELLTASTEETAKPSLEDKINQNKTIVSIVVGVIAVAVLGYFGYQQFIIQPKEQQAQEEIFYAQKAFEDGDYELALSGNEVQSGFLDIVSNFSGTPSANLSNYYIGVSYLHQGDYKLAIEHLKKFSTDSKIFTALKNGALGDAQTELNNYEEAAKYFERAAKVDNDFTAPVFLRKAGLAYEAAGNKEKALKAFEKVKKEYPQSNEAQSIDALIGRIN